MTDDVTLKLVIKTFGQKNNKDLYDIIERALWASQDVRDVCIWEFESSAPSTDEDPTFRRLNELMKEDFEKNPYKSKPLKSVASPIVS
jgi:metal-dependent amidase/aminoacylase/carboxypeptidase family protein